MQARLSYSPLAKDEFCVFKGLFKKKNTRDCIWLANPGIFYIWPYTESLPTTVIDIRLSERSLKQKSLCEILGKTALAYSDRRHSND